MHRIAPITGACTVRDILNRLGTAHGSFIPRSNGRSWPNWGMRERRETAGPGHSSQTRYPLPGIASGAFASRRVNFSIDTEYSPVVAL